REGARADRPGQSLIDEVVVGHPRIVGGEAWIVEEMTEAEVREERGGRRRRGRRECDPLAVARAIGAARARVVAAVPLARARRAPGACARCRRSRGAPRPGRAAPAAARRARCRRAGPRRRPDHGDEAPPARRTRPPGPPPCRPSGTTAASAGPRPDRW